mmetsp:Transcript_20928/g.41755  ORF Transcript_20928/g.41755 Transcript_20928/m.41755 type:complete len:171 (+) Transcript_20928:333-845(+)
MPGWNMVPEGISLESFSKGSSRKSLYRNKIFRLSEMSSVSIRASTRPSIFLFRGSICILLSPPPNWADSLPLGKRTFSPVRPSRLLVLETGEGVRARREERSELSGGGSRKKANSNLENPSTNKHKSIQKHKVTHQEDISALRPYSQVVGRQRDTNERNLGCLNFQKTLL